MKSLIKINCLLRYTRDGNKGGYDSTREGDKGDPMGSPFLLIQTI